MEELRNRTARDAQARNREAVRASELQQPARPGHFLREFGQSDRDQIEASSSEANVPQALRLLNGLVDDQLFRRGSALVQQLDAATRPDEKIRTAFQVVLSRAPSGAELGLWRRDLERDGGTAVRDLVWTLVNSQEFRFLL